MPVIAVVTALHEEVSGLLRRGRFRPVKTSRAVAAYMGIAPGPTNVAVAVSGVGARRSHDATAWLAAEFNPGALLATGFSGGCREDLSPGSVVIASELCKLEGMPLMWGRVALSVPLAPDRELMKLCREQAEVLGMDFKMGRLVSLPSLAKTASMKRWLGSELNASAVDLESYAAAEAAAAAKVPFLAFRPVVDRRDQDLPDIVEVLAGGVEIGRAGTVVRGILKDPLAVATALPRLAVSARRARSEIGSLVFAIAGKWAEAHADGRLFEGAGVS